MNDELLPDNQRSDDDGLSDSLAAYGLGATDADERARIAALLSERPDLRTETARYAAAASLLLADVPMRQPPGDLKARILEAARIDGTETVKSGSIAPLPQPVRSSVSTRSALVWLASAAAVVLLALNVYWLSEVSALRGERTELEALRGELTQQVQDMYKDLSMAVDLVMQEQSRRVELMSDDGAMRAMVVWQPEMSEAVMVTHGLPAVEPGQTYQLWMIGPEGVVSTCMFNTDTDGDMTMVFKVAQSWDNVSSLGISIEPQGGSDAPTSVPLAVGEL